MSEAEIRELMESILDQYIASTMMRNQSKARLRDLMVQHGVRCFHGRIAVVRLGGNGDLRCVSIERRKAIPGNG